VGAQAAGGHLLPGGLTEFPKGRQGREAGVHGVAQDAPVISASDGNEAIEIYRERHGGIDLLILELVMPNPLDEGGSTTSMRVFPWSRSDDDYPS